MADLIQVPVWQSREWFVICGWAGKREGEETTVRESEIYIKEEGEGWNSF